MKVQKLIEKLEKLTGKKVKLTEGLAYDDEQIIIQIGQQIDEKVYAAYLKFKGDDVLLTKAVRAVGRLMKDPTEDEVTITHSLSYAALCRLLGMYDKPTI